MVVNSHPLYQLSYRGSGDLGGPDDHTAPPARRGVISKPLAARNFFAALNPRAVNLEPQAPDTTAKMHCATGR